jgi:hypothetical protein
MSETRCSCDRFETLEGTFVPDYISAFLASLDSAEPTKVDHYRCRWCNQEWKRHSDENSKPPSLVRVKSVSKKSG